MFNTVGPELARSSLRTNSLQYYVSHICKILYHRYGSWSYSKKDIVIVHELPLNNITGNVSL